MLDKKLKEALEIMGGKAILKDGDQYYALLTFKELKKIAISAVEGLTKAELVDKINNDIAGWKVAQEEKKADEVDLDSLGVSAGEEIHYEKTV